VRTVAADSTAGPDLSTACRGERGAASGPLQVRGEGILPVAQADPASYDPRNPSQHLVRGSFESGDIAGRMQEPAMTWTEEVYAWRP
jgi:hypothetical protein